MAENSRKGGSVSTGAAQAVMLGIVRRRTKSTAARSAEVSAKESLPESAA